MTVAGYPRYESYKDSGVEWIGEVPENWKMIRLRYLSKIHSGNGFPIALQGDTSGTIPFLKVSDFKSRNVYISTANNFVTPRIAISNNWNVVPKGSLVTAKIGEAIRQNHRNIVGVACIIDNNCIAFEPKGIDKIYFFYLHKLIDFEWFVNPGAIPSISTSKYKTELVALPSIPVQQSIAAFLDEKCAKIDEAIRIKEEQIKLLHERRQILIQQAVTRGLNPGVPMKDSGIDWIGQIPAHWEIKRIKHIFHKIQTGTTPPTSNDRYFHGEINWYTPPDFQSETLVNSSRKISSLAIKNKEVKLFPKNSILVIGIGATSGKTAFMEDSGTFNQQITGFHTYTGHGKYFYYLFSTISPMVLALANYTTLPILNNEFFKGLLLPKPPVCEQKEIDRYVSELSDKIKKSAAVKQQQITTLKEYKTTLINAAVTGKIRITPDMLPTTTE